MISTTVANPVTLQTEHCAQVTMCHFFFSLFFSSFCFFAFLFFLPFSVPRCCSLCFQHHWQSFSPLLFKLSSNHGVAMHQEVIRASEKNKKTEKKKLEKMQLFKLATEHQPSWKSWASHASVSLSWEPYTGTFGSMSASVMELCWSPASALICV